MKNSYDVNERQHINAEPIEIGEIIGEASTVIFEEIYTEKKYRLGWISVKWNAMDSNKCQ